VDWFTYTLIDRFRMQRYLISECTSSLTYGGDGDMRDEWTQSLLDGMLTQLVVLMHARVYNGRDDVLNLRAELCSALCLAQSSVRYSKLKEALPIRGSTVSDCVEDNFDQVLGELADMVDHGEKSLAGDDGELTTITYQPKGTRMRCVMEHMV
jgi:hypothetical protein